MSEAVDEGWGSAILLPAPPDVGLVTSHGGLFASEPRRDDPCDLHPVSGCAMGFSGDSALPYGIVFGLGRLHHVFSARERERIILGALDAGCTQLDMAPAYGDGLSEAEVGRVLRGRRSEVRIATKFGIPCSSLGGGNPGIYFADKVIRKLLSKSYGSEYAHRDFSGAAARKGVEDSLRRLRTDRIDCLFYHEPRDAMELDTIKNNIETMERLKEEGKIRQYGISADPDVFFVADDLGIVPGDVAQFRVDAAAGQLCQRLRHKVDLSMFGLARFLSDTWRQERIDFGAMLGWIVSEFPGVTPLVATTRLEEIARLKAAISGLCAPLPADGAAGFSRTF